MNTWGLHYQKSDKNYHSYDEYDKNMRRLPEDGYKISARALMIMQKMAEELARAELSRVCPKCHCVKSLKGECLCF